MPDKPLTPEELQEKEVQLHFLKNFIELSTDIFCNLDKNGYCLYVNEAFEKITGFKANDVIGTHLKDFIHPGDIDETFYRFQEKLSGGNASASVLNRLRIKNGSYVFIDWLGKNDDLSQSIFLIGRNVNDKILAEQKLSENQQRVQTIVDNVALSFILFDTTGKILAFNRRMEERLLFVTGKKVKEGLNIREFLLENYGKDFQENFPRVLKGERVVAERKIISHHGHEFWTEASYNPVFDEKKQVTAVAMVLSDITEKKKTEEEIKKLSLVATHTSNSIMICNSERKIEWVNQGFSELSGFTSAEAIGKDALRVLFGDKTDWKSIAGIIAGIQNKKEIRETLISYTKEGSPIWIDLIISPVFDSENNLSHYIAIGTDVTDKLRRQTEIMEKNKLFASISSSLPVLIYIYNIPEQKLEFVSEYVTPVTGYSADEIIARSPAELIRMIPPEEIGALKNSYQQLISNAKLETTSNSFRLRHKEGILRKVNSRETIYKRNEKGAPTHILGSVIDVTEQDSAERYKEAMVRLQSLQQKKTQKIRSLSLLQGQEEERKRLSRELHDGIGQLLTAIRIKLNDIEGSEIGNADLRRRVEEVKDIVLKTIKETRNISNALVPIDLYDFGLDPALKRLADASAQTAGCEVSYDSNLESRRLNPTIEIELFRIVQEALNNSIKYSGASCIDINISYSEKNGALKVLIIDDGKGFDYDPDYIYKKNVTRSYGIRNMNERARIISGKLTIISEKGQGCVISVEVPLKLNAP
jgi:PAS domain S-box-containing protein